MYNWGWGPSLTVLVLLWGFQLDWDRCFFTWHLHRCFPGGMPLFYCRLAFCGPWWATRFSWSGDWSHCWPRFCAEPHNRHLDSSSVAQFPVPFWGGQKRTGVWPSKKSLSIMLRTRSLTLRQWGRGGRSNGAREPVWSAVEEGHVKQR